MTHFGVSQGVAPVSAPQYGHFRVTDSGRHLGRITGKSKKDPAHEGPGE